jgi:hypothetical protein
LLGLVECRASQVNWSGFHWCAGNEHRDWMRTGGVMETLKRIYVLFLLNSRPGGSTLSQFMHIGGGTPSLVNGNPTAATKVI